jgi:hypothetical protein
MHIMHAHVSHQKISVRPVAAATALTKLAAASPSRGGLSYPTSVRSLNMYALFFRASKFSQSLPDNKRANFQKIVRRVRDLLVLSGRIPPNYEMAFQEITSCVLLILIGMYILWI